MEKNSVNNDCRKTWRFFVLVMFIASYNSDDFLKMKEVNLYAFE